MALRNQPYIPLYVQDFSSDEKLLNCSAAATGVYIRLMCLLHKSDKYGCIVLKDKNKIGKNAIDNFASMIAKTMPYEFHIVKKSLEELIDEKVLFVEGDVLFQKRMLRDNEISEKRAAAGKKGGGNPILFKQEYKQTVKQVDKQNPEIEIEIENILINPRLINTNSLKEKVKKEKNSISENFQENKKDSISGDLTKESPKADELPDEVEIIKSSKAESLDLSQERHFKKPKNQKTKKIFVPPLLPEVIEYFLENGETKELAIKYFNHYDKFNWVNSRDKPVLNWKQTAVTNWFGKDFNKKTNQTSTEIMKKQGQAQKEYFEKLAQQQNG